MELLSLITTADLDELAFANERSTREKDTISARRKRCFFMVIGVFPVIGAANFRRNFEVVKESGQC
jgi:hypothetical protein